MYAGGYGFPRVSWFKTEVCVQVLCAQSGFPKSCPGVVSVGMGVDLYARYLYGRESGVVGRSG